MMRAILMAAVLGLTAGPALAQDVMIVDEHQVELRYDDMGMSALVVDGAVLIKDGAVFLDEAVQSFGGLAVLTGMAGPGGNACGAAPFVLTLPKGGAPVLHGPVDSCREFALDVQEDALVFTTEPWPAVPGETWVWTAADGLVEQAPREFAADPALGWEALDSLAWAHPAEALRLAPVLAAVQEGLGSEYPVFAERISGLGSGDLTAGGYLGQACFKFSCEQDWALLYLDRATEQVFVAFAVAGDGDATFWPADTALWPEEAMAALPVATGE